MLGRSDFVKIIDFGLAHIELEPTLTSAGSAFGIPHYMAPELSLGDPASKASDVYALGVITYEMLTGKLPFDANDRNTIAGMHRSQQIPSPQATVTNLLSDMNQLVLRMLAKDPQERPSADEVRSTLIKLQAVRPYRPRGTIARGTVSEADVPEVPGYAVIEELGGGGMARCFKVHHQPTGETLFMKCVIEGSDQAIALKREADIYGRLQYVESAHLLQVRDVWHSRGLFAIITDLADGGDLKTWIQSHDHALPMQEATSIAKDVLQALATLHENTIVHRDIKPERTAQRRVMEGRRFRNCAESCPTNARQDIPTSWHLRIHCTRAMGRGACTPERGHVLVR